MSKKTRRYCLQAFRKTDILRGYIKDCFRINGKQRVKMPTKGEYVKFKNYERKIKSLFMLYVNFGSIPLPEENGKQNLSKSYTNKYQNLLLAVMTIN